jgi:hypothetical protein
MTPKEKAQELVNKYLKVSFGVIEEYIPVPLPFAKQCALIAVDEILKCHIWRFNSVEPYKFWKEVKQEIELL